MRRHTVCALFLLLCVPALFAGVVTFKVIMNGGQETPPVATAGTSTATVVIDETALTILVTLSYSGLSSAATNAHIHCCNGLGVTSPVIIPSVHDGEPGSNRWQYRSAGGLQRLRQHS